jgi:hypothetical protein
LRRYLKAGAATHVALKVMNKANAVATGNANMVAGERDVLAALGGVSSSVSPDASAVDALTGHCGFICNMLASFQDPTSVGTLKYCLPSHPSHFELWEPNGVP